MTTINAESIGSLMRKIHTEPRKPVVWKVHPDLTPFIAAAVYGRTRRITAMRRKGVKRSCA